MAHFIPSPDGLSRSSSRRRAVHWGWWLAGAAFLASLALLVILGRILLLPPLPGQGATAADLLQAGRIAAARQSDEGLENTSWAGDPGQVRHLGGGRYQVNGSVLGRWQGVPGVRRFEAVIEDRRGAMFVYDLPVKGLRFLDP